MDRNLFQDTEIVDFWVWINPHNLLAKHNIEITGSFFSGGVTGKKNSNFLFIPNPEFDGDITPFSFGVLSQYIPEYHLEINRMKNFANYPSRLNSLFLFKSEDDANKYHDRQNDHVGDRVLKKCHSVGTYQYSIHDSSWIDFLRQAQMIDNDSLNNCCNSYWSGISVEKCKLLSKGSIWSEYPIFEVLFIGLVEFYNREL
jgi:hypothetical protein